MDTNNTFDTITLTNPSNTNANVTLSAMTTIDLSSLTTSSVTISPSWINASPTYATVSGSNGSGVIDITGPDADIKLNGESLITRLRVIEDRLNILQPNQKLEAEWDQLRELGEAYRRLEAEILEKQKMWDTLKK